MWFVILLTLFILIILATYYQCVFKPKRIIDSYKKQFEKLGYKVKVCPFAPFNSALQKQIKTDEKQKGDPFYTIKTQSPKYDIILSNLMNLPLIEVIQPKLIKEFFTSQRTGYYPKEEMISKNFIRCLGLGMGLSQGEQWKRKRKIISSAFNFDMLLASIPTIVKLCNENMEMMEKQAEKIDPGTFKYNLHYLWKNLASHIMVEWFFGASASYEKIQGKYLSIFMHELIVDAMSQGTQPISFLLGSKFLDMGIRQKDKETNRKIRLYRQVGKQIVRKRLQQMKKEENLKPKDILQTLYKNKLVGNKSQNSDEFDESELVIQFCNLYMAGTDTVSSYAEIMISKILQNPDIEHKLREEINAYIKDDGDITYENLKKITYIDFIQKEVTRCQGPGTSTLFRRTTKDNYLADLPILKDTLVTYQALGNSYNQKYFKDPFEFRPERWENECDSLPSFVLMGFHGGVRSCLGKQLALLQNKIALIKFFRRYESAEWQNPNPKMKLNLFLAPEPTKTILKRKA